MNMLSKYEGEGGRTHRSLRITNMNMSSKYERGREREGGRERGRENTQVTEANKHEYVRVSMRERGREGGRTHRSLRTTNMNMSSKYEKGGRENTQVTEDNKHEYVE